MINASWAKAEAKAGAQTKAQAQAQAEHVLPVEDPGETRPTGLGPWPGLRALFLFASLELAQPLGAHINFKYPPEMRLGAGLPYLAKRPPAPPGNAVFTHFY